jgi:uncharacterized RDD family membrane protein YckC
MLDGRLALTTPEGVRLLLTPAGPYIRAAAWALDVVLWAVFVIAAGMLIAQTKAGFGVYLLLLFISYWGYPILCEVYWGGRTVGKRAAGIEVLRADGLPVGWRESTLRNLMLVADFLPFAYASGLACMLFDLQFRRLGDIVAGTQVVYSEKKPVLRASALAATPLALPFALTPTQQRTLADLFERERGLPPERMAELGGIASVELLRRYAAGLAQ